MLHFVDGERHKFVEVQIIDDAIPEGAEIPAHPVRAFTWSGAGHQHYR